MNKTQSGPQKKKKKNVRGKPFMTEKVKEIKFILHSSISYFFANH